MVVAPLDSPAKPPLQRIAALDWARANLFSNWWNTLLTLAAGYVVVAGAASLISWGVANAVWSGSPQACQAAATQGGACWAAVTENMRFIFFGRYDYHEQWRAFVAMIVLCAMLLLSTRRAAWKPWLLPAWGAAIIVIGVLMYGGVFGLRFVSQNDWGGLPLTLMLSAIGLVFAFPLGVVLALGRRSNLPIIRVMCVTYIELIRGVPLITVLFMASVMFPLFLPAGSGAWFENLWRAQVAIILFIGAYLAEVVRGGLQAIPKGQYEAADALGLGYWQKTRLIILPQALKISIPPLVNTFIGAFKDTSLVVFVGLFDLLNSAKNAIKEPMWRVYYVEIYFFVALIYFVFCFLMSKYSQKLEKDLAKGVRR